MKKYWYQGVTNDHGHNALLAGPFKSKKECDEYTAAVDNILRAYLGTHWWNRWTASFASDKGSGKFNLKLGLDADERVTA